ncbi:glycosyltransferase family A protein [Agromyces humatus]|uniref:Glycosyltransferase 2-like domain-containing protein n=1 Tax=Agromyces humatus TaxID=279573 RepID=A0ABN2K6P1_9MICO|nr:glycosyltransferase family A protein [Agromyces humatus]
MPDPDVDHIIAVHDPSRPIARAVGSVLDHTRCRVRVTVVCHNTDGAEVRRLLGRRGDDSRLRFIDLDDGIASPSGPFNAGLDAATASYTSIMGSDDELEPGAIDSWLRLARDVGADAVIPRVRHAAGPFVATPPTRPWRRRRLDGVRDRLAYRSAPLGLVARARFGAMRFPPNLGSGEDVQYVAGLWFAGANIAFDRSGPAYLVHADSANRVSTHRRPMSVDTAFVGPLLESTEFSALSPRQREALVVKLLRVNVVSWVVNRPRPDDWTGDDRTELADCASRCISAAPSSLRALSRADRDLLDAVVDPRGPLERVIELGRARGRFASAAALLPRRIVDSLHREAPLRFGVASVLVRGRSR